MIKALISALLLIILSACQGQQLPQDVVVAPWSLQHGVLRYHDTPVTWQLPAPAVCEQCQLSQQVRRHPAGPTTRYELRQGGEVRAIKAHTYLPWVELINGHQRLRFKISQAAGSQAFTLTVEGRDYAIAPATGFHFSYQNRHYEIWFEQLLKRQPSANYSAEQPQFEMKYLLLSR
ncbi:hypothetical protein [uncultured Ferrimonas sp.]|uniref:hypothetical protein n=1 Tax=uncultured Ferrimonas sp. TaxID=432640 RepID=UPI00262B9B1A|nr:hypothetical protein [uncultured Ferrimonas sp.]